MKKSVISFLTGLLFLSSSAFGQLTNGLVAHLNFDNSTNDLSANNIQTTNNGCTFGDDRNNNSNSALILGGSNYVSFNDEDVKVDLPITISAWVKVNSFSSSNVLFRSDNVFNDNFGYWINTGVNTGHISVSIGGGLGGANSSNRRTFKSDLTLTEGEWTHLVCIIRDYNDMDIYFDCVKSTGEYTGSGSQNIVYSNEESRVGSDIGNSFNTSGSYFDGMIDQFAIWDRELSENEFLLLCDKESYLSLSDEAAQVAINIFPNPTSEKLNVEFFDNKNVQGSVYDHAGREVLKFESQGKQEMAVNTSDLSAGMYSIIFRLEDTVISKKFVKQ